MKKVLSLLLCFALLITVSVPQGSAQEISTDLISSSSPIIDVNGNEIGTVYFESERDIKVNADGSRDVKLTTLTKKEYNDGTIEYGVPKTVDIKIVSDDEVYVNGEKVDTSEVYTLEDAERMNNTLFSSGGYNQLTWYHDAAHPTYGDNTLRMSSYPRVSSQLSLTGLLLDPGSGSGTLLTVYQYEGGTYRNDINWFKHYADNVSSARTQISFLVPQLMAVLGVTAITAATIWGLIGGVGAAAVLAGQIVHQSDLGRAAVEDAYDTLRNIPNA